MWRNYTVNTKWAAEGRRRIESAIAEWNREYIPLTVKWGWEVEDDEEWRENLALARDSEQRGGYEPQAGRIQGLEEIVDVQIWPPNQDSKCPYVEGSVFFDQELLLPQETRALFNVLAAIEGEAELWVSPDAPSPDVPVDDARGIVVYGVQKRIPVAGVTREGFAWWLSALEHGASMVRESITKGGDDYWRMALARRARRRSAGE